MKKIKVLIVDDSAFIRKIVEDILKKDSSIEIVAKARNGKEALDILMKQDVDVVTLDVEMPVLNGIDTLERIMKEKPTPVLMLSSLTKKGADLTIKALNLGAIDFITKPSNIFKLSDEEIGTLIIEKVKVASKIKVNRSRIQKRSYYESRAQSGKKTVDIRSKNALISNVVAIGTSTGGPRALQEVIPNISESLKAPILIVQHMPPGFTKSLAERLNNISKVVVKEAEDGDILRNGVAYIAPGNKHITVKADGSNVKIVLDDGSNVSGHKPSVDKMFYSLDELEKKLNIVSVIMTGMGSDGAKGMKLLKENKASKTIAESEETCVVYGMPKSAVNLNVVDKILPVQNIANEINSLLEV